MKSGQVTFFVVLGLLVLVIGWLVVFVSGGYFHDKLGEVLFEKAFINQETILVKKFVDSCLGETVKNGLYYLGQHGGYYEVPEEISIVFFTEDVPYYYIDNVKHVPAVERMEMELNNYVSDNLKGCLDFEGFKKDGLRISYRKYSVTSKIRDKNVKIELDYPMIIQKGDVRANLKDFKFTIDSNIKKLQSVSQELVNSYLEKPGFVCLTCLEELSVGNNVVIKAFPVNDVSVFENNIIWFFIIDKEYALNDKEFILKFVVEQ